MVTCREPRHFSNLAKVGSDSPEIERICDAVNNFLFPGDSDFPHEPCNSFVSGKVFLAFFLVFKIQNRVKISITYRIHCSHCSDLNSTSTREATGQRAFKSYVQGFNYEAPPFLYRNDICALKLTN